MYGICETRLNVESEKRSVEIKLLRRDLLLVRKVKIWLKCQGDRAISYENEKILIYHKWGNIRETALRPFLKHAS